MCRWLPPPWSLLPRHRLTTRRLMWLFQLLHLAPAVRRPTSDLFHSMAPNRQRIVDHLQVISLHHRCTHLRRGLEWIHPSNLSPPQLLHLHLHLQLSCVHPLQVVVRPPLSPRPPADYKTRSDALPLCRLLLHPRLIRLRLLFRRRYSIRHSPHGGTGPSPLRLLLLLLLLPGRRRLRGQRHTPEPHRRPSSWATKATMTISSFRKSPASWIASSPLGLLPLLLLLRHSLLLHHHRRLLLLPALRLNRRSRCRSRRRRRRRLWFRRWRDLFRRRWPRPRAASAPFRCAAPPRSCSSRPPSTPRGCTSGRSSATPGSTRAS